MAFGHFKHSRSTSHFLCLLAYVGPRVMPNYNACNWFTYFFTCNEGLLCCSWFAFSVLLQCVTYESRRLLSLFRSCFYWMCEFQVSKVFDVNSSLEKRLDTMAVSYDFVLPHDLLQLNYSKHILQLLVEKRSAVLDNI